MNTRTDGQVHALGLQHEDSIIDDREKLFALEMQHLDDRFENNQDEGKRM